MTADTEAGSDQAVWLDAEQMAAWLAVIRLVTKLPAALDAHMQHQLSPGGRLNHFEYMVMAMLSSQPGRALRMSDLAALTNASLSRLSHVAKRLEGRNYLRREAVPGDGRATNAILTDEGMAAVVAVAPSHAALVRALVVEPLSPAQLGQLQAAAERIVAQIDATGARPSS